MKNQHWKDLTNLILVAGHAVYVAEDFDNPTSDTKWFLQSFQKGEPPYYIEHILNGVNLAVKDTTALLVFSGGQTRLEAGPKSEAQSYWMIADHFNWWFRTDVKLRVTTEEFARDSYENILFGICRFREAVGKYPKEVTVISWNFKETRFNLHAKAIGFPHDDFHFEGVNYPEDLAMANKGEAKAIDDFRNDLYGVRRNNGYEKDGDNKLIKFLGDKRDERNPFSRHHPYTVFCEELKDSNLKTLLEYKDVKKFNDLEESKELKEILGKLPWNT